MYEAGSATPVMSRGPGPVQLVVVLVVLAAAFAGASGAVAAASAPPLADAGLDQTVPVQTTVVLDAGGSSDPDGSIERVRWTVTAPNGSTVSTSCPNCTRTSFVPSDPGRYAATVAVTGSDGERASDTLYVNATRVALPSVRIRGPARTVVGRPAPYRLDATAGSASLMAVEWIVNGTRERTLGLGSGGTVADVNHTFATTGNYTIAARVADADGYENVTRRNVTVHGRGSSRFEDRPYCGWADLVAAEDADPDQYCSEIFENDLHYSFRGNDSWMDVTGDDEITKAGNVVESYSGNGDSFTTGFREISRSGSLFDQDQDSDLTRSPRGF